MGHVTAGMVHVTAGMGHVTNLIPPASPNPNPTEAAANTTSAMASSERGTSRSSNETAPRGSSSFMGLAVAYIRQGRTLTPGGATRLVAYMRHTGCHHQLNRALAIRPNARRGLSGCRHCRGVLR
jgi:hypothetical protein